MLAELICRLGGCDIQFDDCFCFPSIKQSDGVKRLLHLSVPCEFAGTLYYRAHLLAWDSVRLIFRSPSSPIIGCAYQWGQT